MSTLSVLVLCIITTALCSIPASIANNQTPAHLRESSSNNPVSRGDANWKFNRANRIALKKCHEYAAYRYNNYTIPGKLIGDPPIRKTVLECPQVQTLVLGGKDALPSEFPHMARLGYNEDVTQDEWHSSGSLISERFILSAAHSRFSPTGTLIKWAALGLPSKEEFTSDKIGKNIIRIINHYSRTPEHLDYDIVLYKLEKRVALSPSIRPICIHHEPLQIAINTRVTVTGWGSSMEYRGDTLLKKVRIFNLDTTQCERWLGNGSSVNRIMCGGYPAGRTGGRLCDSGAPMQIPKEDMRCMWVQVGVSSFEPRLPCDGETPGIYTRISAHLPWIQEIVWPFEA